MSKNEEKKKTKTTEEPAAENTAKEEKEESKDMKEIRIKLPTMKNVLKVVGACALGVISFGAGWVCSIFSGNRNKKEERYSELPGHVSYDSDSYSIDATAPVADASDFAE